MKKIIFLSLLTLLILPITIFAETEENEVINTTAAPVVIPYDGVCASNAVIVHEDAQQVIVNAKQSSINSVAVTRRNSLAAAYLLTDKTARDLAIKTAHNIFTAAQKAADKTAKDASVLENNTFKTSMVACGAIQPPKTRDQEDNEDDADGDSSIKNTQEYPGQNGFDQGKGKKLGLYKNMYRRGYTGEDFKKIQEVLGLTADGVFGPKTEAKIKEWQAKKGLKIDGILGEKSIIELENEDQLNPPKNNQPKSWLFFIYNPHKFELY